MAASETYKWMAASEIIWPYALEANVEFKALVSGRPLKVTHIKQTCTWKLQACLSICDLLVDTRH